jgi:hypothetical protein
MHSIDLEFLKQLIGSKVCDVEIYSQLLTDASEEGRIEVVELLLDIGVDTRAYNQALRFASDEGHSEVVKLLIHNRVGARIRNNAPTDKTGAGHRVNADSLTQGTSERNNISRSTLSALSNLYSKIVNVFIKQGRVMTNNAKLFCRNLSLRVKKLSVK